MLCLLQATCNNKKGLLAAGMSEVVQLEFCAAEWRYYYDCLRLHCEVMLLQPAGGLHDCLCLCSG